MLWLSVALDALPFSLHRFFMKSLLQGRVLGWALLGLIAALIGCRTLGPERLVLLPAPQQPPGPRQVVVLGDLHLGLGPHPGKAWDPYEDFRWADELHQLLAVIDAAGGGATDLVLNGDTFELWQSRDSDCQSPNPDIGCSESEALARLARVARAHARELRDLGAFAERGNNRVVFVPGNHDAALLFPAVAAAVEKAAGARRERLQVARAGYWISADGLLYAEHGHQIGFDSANQLRGWPAPFRQGVGGPFLQRPWGEQFVRLFFNRYEDPYPTLDNILPLRDAARYGLASEQLAGGAAAAQAFLHLLLQETSLGQGRGLLLGSRPLPRWDLRRIRAAGDWLLGPQVLPPGEPLSAAVAQAQAEGLFGRTVSELTDTQIVGLCDQRLLLNQVRELSDPTAPTPAICPVLGSLADAASALAGDRDSVLADHLAALQQALRAQRGLTQPLQVFVFSHTHEPEAPFRPQRGSVRPLVLNTGAWQRTASAAVVEAVRARRGLSLPATLPALSPEDLPPCYPLVQIPAYAAGTPPRPRLLFFQQKAGAWKLLPEACALP